MAISNITTNPPVVNKNLDGPDSRVLRSKGVGRKPPSTDAINRMRAACRAYYKANKEQRTKKIIEWQRANPERTKEYKRKWKRANPERMTAYSHKQQGLPMPTRHRPPVCDLCGNPRGKQALHLDHCHETGAFRGWLCGRCNTSIGGLGDNIAGLEAAIDYLRRAMTCPEKE